MPKVFRPKDPQTLSLADAGRVLGTTYGTVLRWVKSGCPSCEDGTVSIWDVVAWKLQKDAGLPGAIIQTPASPAKPNYDLDDDEYLDQTLPSDAEELRERIEWTRERKLLARQKRMENDRELLSRSAVHECFTRWGTMVRAASERVQRKFGPGSADPLIEAMESIEQEFDGAVDDDFGESE